jgi:hypothetical protein
MMKKEIMICSKNYKVLQSLKNEMTTNELQFADCVRLVDRFEVFENLINAMEESPQLIEDSDEVEMKSLSELAKILGDAVDYVKAFSQRNSFIGMTEPSFRQGCASDFAKLNTRLFHLAQLLNLFDEVDYEEKRMEDLEVLFSIFVFFEFFS